MTATAGISISTSSSGPCDARTRVIYAATPGNPTGWTMSAAELQAVIEFCRKKNIWFIADEVYNRLVYDRVVAPSALQFATPTDPVMVVNSFSKTWAMTGWRLGWMVLPLGMVPVMDKLLEFNTSGGQAFLQRAAIAALDQGENFVADQISRYRASRDLVTQRLGGMRRVKLTRSEASMYLMFQVEGEPDSYKLALRLVEEARVGMAPGGGLRGRRRGLSSPLLRRQFQEAEPGHGPAGAGAQLERGRRCICRPISSRKSFRPCTGRCAPHGSPRW